MGAHGFWMGFIIGLSSAAIMLGVRLRWMHKQTDDVQLALAAK
jgi:MATE family multidrug resistance protein